MNEMVKKLACWDTVLKQNKNLTVPTSSCCDWSKNRWLLIGCPFTIDGNMMFQLVEYNEDMCPCQGIFQMVVTEEELIENFEICGKRKSESVEDYYM